MHCAFFTGTSIDTEIAVNIEEAQNAACDEFERIPTEGKLWKSLQSKDFSREVRYFLWMTMHDAYLAGDKRLHPSFLQELQERNQCAEREVVESIKHILTECQSPGQEAVWSLARELWEHKNTFWPWPTLERQSLKLM